MKDTIYTYYQDPGHGWLAVNVEDLIDLNILADISSCSYMKGDTVFLEEDCDMTTFWDAYEDRFGKAPNVTVEQDSEWVRDLPYFEAKVYLKYLYNISNNLNAEINGTYDESYTGQLVNESADIWDMIKKIENEV